MKIAVISDIHGNLEALKEVLADIERAGVDSIICLGDIIGYGPEPERSAQLIRSMAIPRVIGNHELALAKPEFLSWFNDIARESVLLSQKLLSEESKAWLSRLDATLVSHDALFVHGCPPDSIFNYIFEWDDMGIETLFNSFEQRICFIGHTHFLEYICFQDGVIRRNWLGEGEFMLQQDARYIISVGSVGQPRDGNSSSKYVIWDTEKNRLDVRFVPYDIDKTAAGIIRLGFPRINAERLWQG